MSTFWWMPNTRKIPSVFTAQLIYISCRLQNSIKHKTHRAENNKMTIKYWTVASCMQRALHHPVMQLSHCSKSATISHSFFFFLIEWLVIFILIYGFILACFHFKWIMTEFDKIFIKSMCVIDINKRLKLNSVISKFAVTNNNYMTNAKAFIGYMCSQTN